MAHLKKYESFSMSKEFCDRCGKPTNGETIMSLFNEDIICKRCKDKEKKDPNYVLAFKAEMEEIKKGNFNYKGYNPNYHK